jgi:hypothetical protein
MIAGERVELPKGTVEHLIVQVKDRLNNVTDLTTLTPRYDIKRQGSPTYLYTELPATVIGTTLYCLVDTTPEVYTNGTYEIFTYFDNLPEIPRLGPFEFDVNGGAPAIVEPPGSPSSPSSLVSSITVILTDAQIKALPTTPVVIIPATETPNYTTNLTEVPVIVGGLMLANNYAVAYSNVDNAAYFELVLGTDHTPWGSNTTTYPAFAIGGDAMVQLIAGPFAATAVPGALIGPSSTGFDRNFYDNAVRLAMNNQSAGDLTDGDPTNTLQITLLYTFIPVVSQ